jgi:hypothetical protein
VASHDSKLPAADDPSPEDLGERAVVVLDVLTRHPRPAALYTGALLILRDRRNPARIRLAGGALRELMDELQGVAGFAADEPELKRRVRGLADEWELGRASFLAGGAGADAFAQALDSFFGWFNGQRTQRELAMLAFDALNPARVRAAPTVAHQWGEQWMRLRRYFNRTLHGNTDADENRFRERLAELETVIVRWLRPTPLDDFPLLDELRREGPPSV